MNKNLLVVFLVQLAVSQTVLAQKTQLLCEHTFNEASRDAYLSYLKGRAIKTGDGCPILWEGPCLRDTPEYWEDADHPLAHVGAKLRSNIYLVNQDSSGNYLRTMFGTSLVMPSKQFIDNHREVILKIRNLDSEPSQRIANFSSFEQMYGALGFYMNNYRLHHTDWQIDNVISETKYKFETLPPPTDDAWIDRENLVLHLQYRKEWGDLALALDCNVVGSRNEGDDRWLGNQWWSLQETIEESLSKKPLPKNDKAKI